MDGLARINRELMKKRLARRNPWVDPDNLDWLLDVYCPGLGVHIGGRMVNYGPDRIQADESYADWMEDDPVVGGNTTAGSGILGNTLNRHYTLRSVLGSTEIRTLADPTKAFVFMGFTLLVRTSSNLVIRCSTPIWIGATVTQPAITQNGQFITFTATNHSIFLQSVPCTKTSFTGTQTTFVNTTGFRWMQVMSDGPTVT